MSQILFYVFSLFYRKYKHLSNHLKSTHRIPCSVRCFLVIALELLKTASYGLFSVWYLSCSRILHSLKHKRSVPSNSLCSIKTFSTLSLNKSLYILLFSSLICFSSAVFFFFFSFPINVFHSTWNSTVFFEIEK